MFISEETRKKLVERLNRDLEQDVSNVETNELLDILDPREDEKEYIIQARHAVETYYPIDSEGNVDWEHPYEVNDCIEPEYVVREKTADNCYGDSADYYTYDEALKHLKELKGEQ